MTSATIWRRAAWGSPVLPAARSIRSAPLRPCGFFRLPTYAKPTLAAAFFARRRCTTRFVPFTAATTPFTALSTLE